MKAPVCSHPILQYVLDIVYFEKERSVLFILFLFFNRHIKHLGPNRFDTERTTTTQTRAKEQSRSLPRIPLPVCRVFFSNFCF